MKPLIVVSSKTGNTRVIARALQDGIGPCDYVEASQVPADLSAYNPIVLCFWCDRGMAPEDTKAVAKRIKGKDIACFATMGGDPENPKAKDWMHRTSRHWSRQERTTRSSWNSYAEAALIRNFLPA